MIHLLSITKVIELTSPLLGKPCDKDGTPLEEGTPPPYTSASNSDWSPYSNRLEFEMADFLFTKSQSSAREIDFLMDTFTAFGYSFGADPPFADHTDMYNVIDSTSLGDAPWSSFTAQYSGSLPSEDIPSWMTTKYDVWCRDPHIVLQNMLSNPDFNGEIDYAPYRKYAGGKREYTNLMSGNWAWRQAVSNISFTIPLSLTLCLFRIRSSLQIQVQKVLCYFRLFSEVIKPLFQSPQARTSIIRSTYLLETSSTMSDVLIVMQ